MLFDDREAAIGELAAASVVPTTLEIVRRVLTEHRHEMFAGRCDGRIDGRWDRAFDDRCARHRAVLRLVVRALDEVLIRAQVDRAAMLRTRRRTWARREVRQRRQRDVYLRGCARVVDALDRR